MRRHRLDPRPDWKAKVARIGLTYHSLNDASPYWDESAYWEFSAAEIDRLEAATAEVQRLALAAGDAMLDRDLLQRMHIPPAAAHYIRETWQSEPPALYGRLDLAFDGRQIKLLEYNADTPTALVEAAVARGTGSKSASPRRISSTQCTRSWWRSGRIWLPMLRSPSTSLTTAAKKTP